MKFEETYLNDNILDALYDMHFVLRYRRAVSHRYSIIMMSSE